MGHENDRYSRRRRVFKFSTRPMKATSPFIFSSFLSGKPRGDRGGKSDSASLNEKKRSSRRTLAASADFFSLRATTAAGTDGAVPSSAGVGKINSALPVARNGRSGAWASLGALFLFLTAAPCRPDGVTF